MDNESSIYSKIATAQDCFFSRDTSESVIDFFYSISFLTTNLAYLFRTRFFCVKKCVCKKSINSFHCILKVLYFILKKPMTISLLKRSFFQKYRFCEISKKEQYFYACAYSALNCYFQSFSQLWTFSEIATYVHSRVCSTKKSTYESRETQADDKTSKNLGL